MVVSDLKGVCDLPCVRVGLKDFKSLIHGWDGCAGDVSKRGAGIQEDRGAPGRRAASAGITDVKSTTFGTAHKR